MNETAGHSAWNIDRIDITYVTNQLMILTDSILWQHTRRILAEIKKNKSGEVIRSIEIGCGLAKLSFLIGLYGGRITLLDSSSVTLMNAETVAQHLGLRPEIQCENALELPGSLAGGYDMAVSLGVNEHFINRSRQQIFDAHYKVLNTGGWAIISVPNRYCISYRLATAGYKWTDRWPEDLIEEPFTRGELLMRMRQASFKQVNVWSGSRPKDDFDFFIMTNLKSVIRKMLNIRKKDKYAKQVELKDLHAAVSRSRQFEPFINNQSYSWVAVGQRI